MLFRKRRPGPGEFAHDQDPRRAKKALRADLSWPTHKTAPVMPFEPMDVDRFEDLGLVVASQRGRLQTYWFVNRNGRWEWQGGTGGGGSGAFERPGGQPGDVDQVIWCSQGGCSGRMRDVVVRCSPEVQLVTVERPGDIRHADVSNGPGCIGIIWPEEVEPMVRAFSSAGTEIGSVAVGDFDRHPVGMVECACPTCLHGRLYVPRELVGPMRNLNFLPDGFEAVCQPSSVTGRALPNCGLRHRCLDDIGWIQVARPGES